MRIDKAMIVKDIEKCIDLSTSFVFVSANELDSPKELAVRNIVRQFGNSVIFRKFPKRMLLKVFKAKKNVEFDEIEGSVSVACISERVDPASFIQSILQYNEIANKGVKSANRKQYVKVVSGIIFDEVFNTKRADILSKLPTISDIRSSLLSMIMYPTTSVIGMINSKIEE